MKYLKDIKLNSAELLFLTGQKIPHCVHDKMMDAKERLSLTLAQLDKKRYAISDIIKHGKLKLTSSNDPRYDKQEPIMFAINQLRELGLPKQLRSDILSDKYCITKQVLSAKYFILNDILTKTQLAELYSQLKAKLEYHTNAQEDLMGGELPAFINFGTANVLANIKDYTPKKRKKNGTKSIGETTRVNG